jgi:hypothetical protein
VKNIINQCSLLVTQEEYYKAHEVLEDLWRELKKNESNQTLAIKGLTNGATSLELAKRGRTAASVKVWQTFLKYHHLIKSSPNDLSSLSLLLVQHYERLHLAGIMRK